VACWRWSGIKTTRGKGNFVVLEYVNILSIWAHIGVLVIPKKCIYLFFFLMQTICLTYDYNSAFYLLDVFE
jgi:hypothetical protein